MTMVTCLERLIVHLENGRERLSISKHLCTPNSRTTGSSLWISHFRTVLPEVLSWVSSILPPQWYSGDLRGLMGELFHRLVNLLEGLLLYSQVWRIDRWL